MLLTTKQLRKRNDLRKLPVVMAIWIDAASCGEWKQVDDYMSNGNTVECVSVGFLLANDKHKLMLVQNMSENSTVSDSICIPKACIKSWRVVSRGVK